MFALRKKFICIIAACALAVAGLAGCAQPEPQNTEELLAAYENLADNDNFHGDISVKGSIEFLGIDVPLSMSGTLDQVGKNAHMELKVSALEQESTSEVYIEGGEKEHTQYLRSSEDDEKQWVKSTVKTEGPLNSITSTDLLKDAEFKKTDDGYELAVSFEKVLDALEASGAELESLEELKSDEAMQSFIKDSYVTFVFNKECRLTSISMDIDFTYEESSGSGSDEEEMSMTLKMDATIEASDYGKVDASSVAVPKDVKKNAIDQGEINDDLLSLLEE